MLNGSSAATVQMQCKGGSAFCYTVALAAWLFWVNHERTPTSCMLLRMQLVLVGQQEQKPCCFCQTMEAQKPPRALQKRPGLHENRSTYQSTYGTLQGVRAAAQAQQLQGAGGRERCDH